MNVVSLQIMMDECCISDGPTLVHCCMLAGEGFYSVVHLKKSAQYCTELVVSIGTVHNKFFF